MKLLCSHGQVMPNCFDDRFFFNWRLFLNKNWLQLGLGANEIHFGSPKFPKDKFVWPFSWKNGLFLIGWIIFHARLKPMPSLSYRSQKKFKRLVAFFRMTFAVSTFLLSSMPDILLVLYIIQKIWWQAYWIVCLDTKQANMTLFRQLYLLLWKNYVLKKTSKVWNSLSTSLRVLLMYMRRNSLKNSYEFALNSFGPCFCFWFWFGFGQETLGNT